MPATDYLPNGDADIAEWLGNFIQVANLNMDTLHLTMQDLTPITTDTNTFLANSATIAAAKQAAKVATQARRITRKTVVADARALVKSIQAMPDISDTLKTDLRITVSSGRRPQVPVFMPTMLSVTLKPDMRVYVKWDRDANHYGALYVVERKCAGDTAWTQIKSLTATRFYDDGCGAGVQATYRVTATRGLLKSMPSAEVNVYK